MSTQTEVILNRICREAAERKASEIYLLPAQSPFIRVDGVLKTPTGEGIISLSFINDLIPILLNSEEQNILKKERQIEIIKSIGKIGSSQINVYYQKNELACRIKLLAQEIIALEKLGLPEMVTNFANLLKGIVFITGPRDSGRSTLLTSLLDHINKTQVKFISTLEKPIKATLRGVKSVVEQREVGKDVPSFLDGLRYIRKRNAEIVMVSQIKRVEEVKEIFAIAEAGSLVFTIMDTASAVKTIRRILHFFPAEEQESVRYFLSENLGGIVASRLVPKIGGGRIRALEVLPGTPAVRSIIATGRLHQLTGVIQASEDQTSISLDQYLVDLVTSSKVITEDAVKYSVDEELFRSLLRR